MNNQVIVIGIGFGALGAAVRLAARGFRVKMFEKRDKPGGRAYVYELNGFKFDGGPTVITAPFMFDDIFAAAGRRRKDYFQFVPCDPFYRIFNHEGRTFDYNGNHEFILQQIAKWNPADQAGYTQFMASTKAIFEKGFQELADKPFLQFQDMLKVAPDLIRLQSHKTVYEYASQFIEDDFLRRCFSFHPLLVGGNPFDTTSIYAMIHYLEREWGIHYAVGGTGAIVDGLVRLFNELGGEIYLNSSVEEILIDAGQATGIRLDDGTIHQADHIISNADVASTYLNMIPARYRGFRNSDLRYKKLTRYSMSLFVIYFGTKRRYNTTNLAHHNIILGDRYQELLTDIFKRKHLSDDFSLYLHMPTLTDPSIAPDGCESFYVLSPVPHLGADIDWTKAAKPYRNKIMQFLEDNYLPDLQENIVAEHYIDPLHFQHTLNSYLGSAFSVEPILTQSAWFRPHNRSEDVGNLYFVGAGTHPGAGLPGVLPSSKIARRFNCGGLGMTDMGCPLPVADGPAGLQALRTLLKRRSLLGALEAMHTHVGDIFQITLPRFTPAVLVGPDTNRQVLVSRRDEFQWRTETDPVTCLLRHGLLVEDGDAHQNLRAHMEPILQRRQVTKHVNDFCRYTDHIVATWGEGQRDMLIEMRKLALLILMGTLFKVEFGPDMEHLWPAILGVIKYISPGMWIVWPNIPRFGYQRAIDQMDEYLYRIIQERRANPGEPDDLLGYLITIPEFNDTIIRDQLLTMLIAGHDTSTALLAWVLYLLGKHPVVMAKTKAEVDNVLGAKIPTMTDLTQLHYLDQVIKETLRLYPPIHIGNRMAKTDMTVNNYHVPKGTRVMYSIYLSHRHPEYWPDPEEFRPERFARQSSLTDSKRPPFTYLPFGGGPRNCIGAAFAQIEAKAVLARILQSVDLNLISQHVRASMGATLEPYPGVIMGVKRRSSFRV